MCKTLVIDKSQWRSNDAYSNGAYCWFGNDISNKTVSGALYNGYAVQSQKLCPAGWYVPTEDDWETLELTLGMTHTEINSTGWRGTDQGSKLKFESGWNNNGNGTNSSGFSALPVGIRESGNTDFSGLGTFTTWWSSTSSMGFATTRSLSYDSDKIYRMTLVMVYGFSVRCIKDNNNSTSTLYLNTGSFKVYPNPAHDKLFININKSIGPERIEAFNMQGQMVFSTILSGTTTHVIDVKNWPPGIYVVRLVAGDQLFSEKFRVVK